MLKKINLQKLKNVQNLEKQLKKKKQQQSISFKYKIVLKNVYFETDVEKCFIIKQTFY